MEWAGHVLGWHGLDSLRDGVTMVWAGHGLWWPWAGVPMGCSVLDVIWYAEGAGTDTVLDGHGFGRQWSWSIMGWADHELGRPWVGSTMGCAGHGLGEPWAGPPMVWICHGLVRLRAEPALAWPAMG
jgi:hypothetical protein